MALDETIDSIGEHPLNKLAKYAYPGIVAVVSGNLWVHLLACHCSKETVVRYCHMHKLGRL